MIILIVTIATKTIARRLIVRMAIEDIYGKYCDCKDPEREDNDCKDNSSKDKEDNNCKDDSSEDKEENTCNEFDDGDEQVAYIKAGYIGEPQ